MERSSFCVHPSAKKRIKSLICHWGESPSLVQIVLFPRHQINLSDNPLTFFSRLAHSWISSFMINWYEGQLTHMIVFHHYLLHWKTLQEWFSTYVLPTEQRFAVLWGRISSLTCFIRSLWRRHLKQLTLPPGKAAKRGSWDDVLMLCLIIFWSCPGFFWASWKGRICLHHTAAYLRTKFGMIFLGICNDSQLLWNEMWLKRHSW